MLDQLTPQQEQLMLETKQRYLDYIFSCKNSINREKVKAGIDWLYKFSGLKSPIVIFVDSPLGCQFAVPLLKAYWKVLFKAQVGAQVGDQVRAQVWDQAWAQVRNQVRDQVRDQVWVQVGDQAWAQVRNQVRNQVGDPVWDKVWDQVGAQVRDKVWDQVGAQVRDQVGAQVRAQVWDQVRDQVGTQVREYTEFSRYASIWDLGWISFYDFFQQIGIAQNQYFSNFKELVISGVYDMIQLNGFCIVSNLPSQISRNRDNRLHSDKGPAIQFRDGYKLWFWNGVAVPQNWVENPESITSETIAKEENAERRRCLMEILGTEKFAETLGIQNIGMDYLNGREVVLFRTVRTDPVTRDIHYYVKVTCPSTNRKYFLCVPEEAAKDPLTALAWTFNMTKEQYMPQIEA